MRSRSSWRSAIPRGSGATRIRSSLRRSTRGGATRLFQGALLEDEGAAHRTGPRAGYRRAYMLLLEANLPEARRRTVQGYPSLVLRTSSFRRRRRSRTGGSDSRRRYPLRRSRRCGIRANQAHVLQADELELMAAQKGMPTRPHFVIAALAEQYSLALGRGAPDGASHDQRSTTGGQRTERQEVDRTEARRGWPAPARTPSSTACAGRGSRRGGVRVRTVRREPRRDRAGCGTQHARVRTPSRDLQEETSPVEEILSRRSTVGGQCLQRRPPAGRHGARGTLPRPGRRHGRRAISKAEIAALHNLER